MGNFNRDKRSGGGKRGDFGGGRQQMYHAVCSQCGNDCEVPFRPTGDKPVYCNQCFSTQSGKGFNRGSERFNREYKRMFDAVCAKCGSRCQVPFRPTGDKPVYCSNCFDKGDRGGARGGGGKGDQYKDQLAVINSKLDQILKALNPTVKPLAKTEAVAKETVKKTPVKVVVKKVAKKKKK
ncbi:MAG: CxxC-x17-CxxC domain-containing protein [Patescibacteria group bacterium]|jgi:CxxC-x17-CxxC domain-containing protein